MRSFRLPVSILTIIFGSLLLLISTSAFAEITKLSAEDKVLLNQPASKTVYKVAEIPAAILAACAQIIKEPKFKIIDAGEPFQETSQAKRTSSSDKRRLIWAAKLSDAYLINYETSGTVHTFHLGLVKMSGKDQATVTWIAMANRKLINFNDFISAMMGGGIDDRFAYLS